MSHKIPHNPRLQRKKTLEQQETVDLILQVVADQGRRHSLSQVDYSVQNNLESGLTRIRRLHSEGTISDDLSSCCTSGSDLSNSPPPKTQDSGISNQLGRPNVFHWRSAPRILPPLNCVRAQRSSRQTHDNERARNCLPQRISRLKSARGTGSRPHPRDIG